LSESVPFQNKTSYIIDAENAAEMARLMMLATQMTESMGPLFPPQLDVSSIHDVIDIACGPGQWVVEVARTYPHIQAIGGDISQLMTTYASSLVRDFPNARFQRMNAQQPIDFPDQTFDVVQARLITAFMRTTEWPSLLNECRRILRPGGTLCLAECESAGVSNSAALEQYNALLVQAMRQTGHCFSPEGNMFGITPLLPRLLEQQGFTNITQRAFALNFSARQKAHEPIYANSRTALKLVQPFLISEKVATQPELDILYERALKDLQSPEFCGQWYFMAISGEKPLEA
jgi:ubiquinone/menaquinone biosynthesis C-methylase UbiE